MYFSSTEIMVVHLGDVWEQFDFETMIALDGAF